MFLRIHTQERSYEKNKQQCLLHLFNELFPFLHNDAFGCVTFCYLLSCEVVELFLGSFAKRAAYGCRVVIVDGNDSACVDVGEGIDVSVDNGCDAFAIQAEDIADIL